MRFLISATIFFCSLLLTLYDFSIGTFEDSSDSLTCRVLSQYYLKYSGVLAKRFSILSTGSLVTIVPF